MEAKSAFNTSSCFSNVSRRCRIFPKIRLSHLFLQRSLSNIALGNAGTSADDVEPGVDNQCLCFSIGSKAGVRSGSLSKSLGSSHQLIIWLLSSAKTTLSHGRGHESGEENGGKLELHSGYCKRAVLLKEWTEEKMMGMVVKRNSTGGECERSYRRMFPSEGWYSDPTLSSEYAVECRYPSHAVHC